MGACWGRVPGKAPESGVHPSLRPTGLASCQAQNKLTLCTGVGAQEVTLYRGQVPSRATAQLQRGSESLGEVEVARRRSLPWSAIEGREFFGKNGPELI